MAALVEGQQYGLSAQDKINCTKSLVFVKLTDSAIRSIEEYVKIKGDTNSKPTIQFQNSNGVISLPQSSSNQTYGFTLSNVEADGPHGSFECLRQTGRRSLESLGCLQVKMHIHANEDSYENTRVKMAAVEKEQKKSCAKVIKPAGAHLGRKVKVKRPGLVISPIKFSPPTASMVKKPPPPPPVVCAPVKRPEIPKPNPKKNSEVLRQPIRDRIIHILAIRPYKRPELLVRLNQDGVREKDKNKLTSILPQLSVLKGNIYYLANYLWNEVQESWKFCTQEELEIIRKRKRQHLNSASEIETPPSLPSSSPLQKRLSSEVVTNGNPRSKKQRISHYKGDQQRPAYSGPSTDLHTTTLNRKSPYSPGLVQSSTNPYEDDLVQKSPFACDNYSTTTPKSSDKQSPSSLNQRIGTREDSEKSIRNHTAGDPLATSSLNQRMGSREDSEKSIRNHTAGDPLATSSLNQRMGTREDSEKSIRNHTAGDPLATSSLNQRMGTREDEKGIRSHSSSDTHSTSSLNQRIGSREDNEKNTRSLSSSDNYPPTAKKAPSSDDQFSSSSLNQRTGTREENEKGIRSHTSGLSQKGHSPVKRHAPTGLCPKNSYVNNSDTGKPQTLSHPRPVDVKAQVSPDSAGLVKEVKGGACSKTSSNGYVNTSIKNNYNGNQSSYINRSKVTSTTNGSCGNSPHSSCDSMDYNDSELQVPPPTESPAQCDSPEYEKEYSRIVSSEQRARYKAHFNAEYGEYLCLHKEIISISKKFASLEHHLHTCPEESEEFKKIKGRIYKEYRAYQQDPNYIESLKKFNFLHTKLAHIKRLVTEYDTAQCTRS